MPRLRLFLDVSEQQAKVLVCVLTGLIAGADFGVPSDINIASFYFICIVLLIWVHSIQWLWTGTIIFITLAFAGIPLGRSPVVHPVSWVDWLNRSFTALALAVAAVPVHLRLRAIAQRDKAQQAVQERTRELQTSEHSLRQLSISLMHSQDEERRRIARELHDSIGQYLSHSKLLLESWLKKNQASGREIEDLSQVGDSLDRSLTETRTISHLLHPPLLDELGLVSAARVYVDGFGRRTGVRTNVKFPPEMGRLPPALELVLFRILQESLTNVLRHAQSPTVDIELRNDGRQVSLTVRDFGKGMPREFIERFNTCGEGAGVGLTGMRERMAEFHGDLRIESCEVGTLIRAILPLS